MIVIVEGIDRVGKTTLCNLLKEQLGLKIYKKEREGGNNANTLLANLVNFANATGHISFWKSDICKDISFVVDRFSWTELVYSTVLRQNPNELMNLINEDLEEMDHVLMVLIRPTDISWSSNQHGEDLEPYSKMFDELFKNYKGHKIATDHEHLQEVVDYIKERVANHEK